MIARNPLQGSPAAGGQDQHAAESFFTVSGGSPPADRIKLIEEMALEYTLGDVVHAIESLQTTYPTLFETDKRIEEMNGTWMDIHGDLHRLADAIEYMARPLPPVGLFAVVLGCFDEGNDETTMAYGEIVAYYPPDNYFIKDGLGNVERVRIYTADDSNPDAYTMGPIFFYKRIEEMIKHLEGQHERERFARAQPVKQESLLS